MMMRTDRGEGRERAGQMLQVGGDGTQQQLQGGIRGQNGILSKSGFGGSTVVAVRVVFMTSVSSIIEDASMSDEMH